MRGATGILELLGSSLGQRAAIGVEYKTRFAVLAKERQVAAGKEYGRGQEKVPQKIAEAKNAEEGEARAQAAKVVGTNRQYIDDAEKIKDNAPTVFDALKDGIRLNNRPVTPRNPVKDTFS